MKQVTFIHTADLHLDAAFSSLGDENKARIRREELENCFSRITEEVRTGNVDLFIISGDFFEDGYVKASTILKARNLFSELYRTEIVICPGNHDPLKENSYYKTSEWGGNVHILEDTDRVLYFEKYNTCIYNLGVKGNLQQDYSALKNMDISGDRVNLLVFHGTVDMPFEEDNYNPITSEASFSLGMDYIALGHTHRYFRIRNERTLMVNPGSPEPMGFDEEGEHGWVRGTVSLEEGGKSAEAQFIPCSARQYHNYEIDISDCSGDDQVISRILSEGRIKLSAADLYSITLKGFIPVNYMPGIKNIVDALARHCFFVKIKNQTSVQFEYERYLEEPGIKGEYVRRIMDMWEAESSQEKRETLFMALQYGLQALENGRVD